MNNGTITYSKSERKWLYDPVGNGPVMSFDKGPAGKKKAQEAFMHTEAPKVFKLVQSVESRFDEPIATRFFKAGLLVTESLVISPTREEVLRDNTILARIGSKYTVEHIIRPGKPMTANLFECTCPDWAKGWARENMPENSTYTPADTVGAPILYNAGIMCKHVFAYQLNKQTDRVMSIQNPYSQVLSNRMLDMMQTHFLEDFEITDMIKNGTPGQFGRGTWTLKLDEPGKAYFQIADEQYQRLRIWVTQKTEGSQQLIIV